MGGKTAVSKHHEALNVLITVRRRVLDRLAETVTGNKSDFLRASAGGAGPFTGLPELHQLTDALWRLDTAIAALRRLVRKANGAFPAPVPDDDDDAGGSRRAKADPTFAWFIELVGEQRLEEASRELLRILRMPLDRVMTATRFFARASRVNPDLVPALAGLPRRLRSASSAQAMSLLVRTFGFQAVETRMAVQALLATSGAQPAGIARHPSPVR